ncbi:hypothetical protein OCB08_21580 [Bacillus cereus]|uniref:hypothetical protein n=1 Tax=Bacillus cereus group TaxID=86661 RepID=UPI001D0F3F51|nr:hypothetical protein [Bacillus cereus]MCC2370276.1 hypothetical protein [Bacillus cereus]MCC2450157.1 hypothetical protein [Bacillus cereus]MCC2491175.1 hypothetical protein [Bacillus cereus]MCU5627952.1 hypothetical protein [Bacillus cereus]MDF9552218.1 hypothetical protein [Bacillus cereus]
MDLELFKEEVNKRMREKHSRMTLDTDGWITVMYECISVYNENREKEICKSVAKEMRTSQKYR